MESKFTPGPWEFSIEGGEIAQVIAKSTAQNLYDGDTICIPEIPPSGCRHEAYAVQEANTRLIAAAPDLLEALQALAHKYRNAPLTDEWISALTAIKKALGED